MPTLDWIGKQAVVNHHREVPYRLVHCDSELSAGDPDAGNLLVQGDNLEALRALLPYYAGKVKCIYIDPPFNTGSEEWIYNDNVNSPEISHWLGQTVKGEDEDLSRHDKWLCMMFPRIRLLKDFLRSDGTLFVHIDDNELAACLMLFDEIFGRKNRQFIATFKQGSATGHKAINPGVVSITSYVIAYARDKSEWSPNRVYTGRSRDTRYGNWVKNREEHHSVWEITTLMAGFAEKQNISVGEARKLAKEKPEMLDAFVLKNAKSVVQPASPNYESVGQATRDAIDESVRNPNIVVRQEREGYADIFLKGGKRLLFYSDKIKIIDGVPVSGEPLTSLWDDVLSNNLHAEGGVSFPKGKKPEALIRRCFDLATDEGDIVMDSFGGSGSTAAVAHKMQLKYLIIEMGEHAETHIATRLERVISGEDNSGISGDLEWQGGGGFRFCRLGNPLFDEFGDVAAEVTFPDLAAHIFFSETGVPIPQKAKSEYLGVFQDRAVYLLFDPAHTETPREAAGNVLTPDRLDALPAPPETFEGQRVIYAEGCTVSKDRLNRAGAVFKQIPYQIDGV